MREYQQAVNPRTGRLEVVFTDLRQVYPEFDDPMAVEYSFEELRAKRRGWTEYDWDAIRQEEQAILKSKVEPLVLPEQPKTASAPLAPKEQPQITHKPQTVPLKGSIEDDLRENDENVPPSQAEIEKAKLARRARREERANRTRKIKVMEVREIRGETQTSRSK